MPLTFPDGRPFTIGAASYSYRPATENETTERIIVEIQIGEITTEAVVDTGGVYLFCTPSIADRLSLDEESALSGVKEILFRGQWVKGRLYRLGLVLLAEEGNSLNFEATAFVPEDYREDTWVEIPCFLGLFGCLERLRFAVNPDLDKPTFYFGPIS